MSDQINDGGPAFPGECGDKQHDPRRGMSLRDYFAGQIVPHVGAGEPKYRAEYAYKLADAMLAARKEAPRE